MGRKKIAIEKIENKQYRMQTFSKRKNGLFKKAQEYSLLSGAAVAILVVSQAGVAYTDGSPSCDSVMDKFLSATDEGSSITSSSTTTSGSTTSCSTTSSGCSQDTLKSWLEYNHEACEDIEVLMALKRDLDQVRRHGRRLIE